ncbi:putative nucleic acid-binding protein [Neorhizobium galegae]|uniref:type II toxin-antitoxin system VapC family toxin n=1 Tax=Neorhizobium galegae TaxID=399 RepID=UPI001ECF28D5|nr:type II toxin-antitoxin system VapC family toxin [Neorhizobium galegae]MBP2560445.1 putative nucleic acid-binding protein [Neorhizobium galegae]MDQ0133217.1 putative nucleic acid-binding protein [Neorhizobium galegae]
MGFLLDTNAVSMFSPSRAGTSSAFASWVEEQEKLETVYLSAVTIHEIEKGVRLLEAKGATSKAALIELFLQGLIAGYSDRILPIDAGTARESGRLEAIAMSAGHSPGMADAMIAGTASLHGLTIITRNLKHFLPFGVAVKAPDALSL